jgi:hypothetical protein
LRPPCPASAAAKSRVQKELAEIGRQSARGGSGFFSLIITVAFRASPIVKYPALLSRGGISGLFFIPFTNRRSLSFRRLCHFSDLPARAPHRRKYGRADLRIFSKFLCPFLSENRSDILPDDIVFIADIRGV